LVVHTSGDEARKRAGKGNLATQRQACRDADHVGLGNAGLDKAVGMGFLEIAHLQTAGYVSAKCENTGITFACLSQSSTEARTRVFEVITSYVFHILDIFSRQKNVCKITQKNCSVEMFLLYLQPLQEVGAVLEGLEGVFFGNEVGNEVHGLQHVHGLGLDDGH